MSHNNTLTLNTKHEEHTVRDDYKMAAGSVWAVVIILGSAVLLLRQTGEAIKCFNCNSAHQADCVDWFDNVTNHLVECFSWQTKCRKVVQEILLDGHWDVRYIRQCAGSDSPVGAFDGRICKEVYGISNVRVRYCHCDNQDGCNSAPAVRTADSVLTGLTLITLSVIAATVLSVQT